MPIITKPSKPPLWATNTGVVVEPTEPKKQTGWTAEKPAFQHMNWIHYTNYLWQQYFESYLDTITNAEINFDESQNRLGIDVTPATKLHTRLSVASGAASVNSSQDVAAFEGNTIALLNLITSEGGSNSSSGLHFSDVLRGAGSIQYIHRESSADVDAFRFIIQGVNVLQMQKNPDNTARLEIGMTNPGIGAGNLQIGQGTQKGIVNVGNPGNGIRPALSSGNIAITFNGNPSNVANEIVTERATAAGASALIVQQDGALSFYGTNSTVSQGEIVNESAKAKFYINTLGDIGFGNDSPVSLGSSITTMEIRGRAVGRTGGLSLTSSDSSFKLTAVGASSGIGNSSGNVPLGIGSHSTHAFGVFIGNQTAMVIGADKRFQFGGNNIQSNALAQFGNFGGYLGSEPVVRMTRADGGGSNGIDFICNASFNKISTHGTSKVLQIMQEASESVQIGTNSSVRVWVDSNGSVGVGAAPLGSRKLDVHQSANIAAVRGYGTGASYTGSCYQADVNRSASVDFTFYQARSDIDGASDTEFVLRGDGNAFADGSWSGGGADYAEYFDSKSGKALLPGITVVLEGNKIRPSKEGEKPIGVVRPEGASAIIGNNSWNHWKGKYLKDDFGGYLKQEIEYVKWTIDITEDQEVQKTKTVKKESFEVIKDGDSYIEKKVAKNIEEGVFIEHPVLDKDGAPIYEVKQEEIINRVEVTPPIWNEDGTLKYEGIYEDRVIQEEIKVPKVFLEPVMETKLVKVGEKEVCHKVSELGDADVPEDAVYFTRSEKVLNPEYDPTLEYLTPEERPEKNLIGLLGQIPVRKGQPLNDSWIKMGDINDTVELYYIS